MPSKVKVRVSTVEHTTITDAKGVDRNWIVLKGFDVDANKGFKKQFFATKTDGSPTKNAQTADQVGANEWVELTLDDSTWKNVQTLRKISAPSGVSAPDQTEYNEKAATRPVRGGSGGKAFRTVPQLNREHALAQAVTLVAAKAIKIKDGSDIINIAVKLEDYLIHGVGVPEPENQSETMPPPAKTVDSAPPIDDDDIPF